MAYKATRDLTRRPRSRSGGVHSAYKAGIDVLPLPALLDQTVQPDHGDVVVLDPGGQAAQPLV